MIFSSLSKRERKITVTTAIIVGACAIFNLFIYPTIIRWQRLGEEITKLNVDLYKMERNLQLRDRIESEYRKYERQILTTGSNEEEIANLLREVETLSRHIGLYMRSIRPFPIQDEGFYRKYTVQVEVEGEMRTIGKFLYSLQNSPQLLKVERLQINARTATEMLRTNLLISRVSAGRKKEAKSEI